MGYNHRVILAKSVKAIQELSNENKIIKEENKLIKKENEMLKLKLNELIDNLTNKGIL